MGTILHQEYDKTNKNTRPKIIIQAGGKGTRLE